MGGGKLGRWWERDGTLWGLGEGVGIFGLGYYVDFFFRFLERFFVVARCLVFFGSIIVFF